MPPLEGIQGRSAPLADTNVLMIEQLQKLIEALRDEMKQYGEMLALLDRPQHLGSASLADEMLQTVAALRAQDHSIATAWRHRRANQNELAGLVGKPPGTPLLQLLAFLPVTYRPLVTALAQENEHLRLRVQQRAGLNQRQLGRALEFLQRSMKALVPACTETCSMPESVPVAD
ncbi:MAG: flagellar export chaperone FlgN [Verrucomicrobia bacterium]|nr:flagellar export chaperone FlgN [Verrucomicrobiota bacterium]